MSSWLQSAKIFMLTGWPKFVVTEVLRLVLCWNDLSFSVWRVREQLENPEMLPERISSAFMSNNSSSETPIDSLLFLVNFVRKLQEISFRTGLLVFAML